MRSAWRATARPARSTSTSSGVPCSIACRSAAAISAGVSTTFTRCPSLLPVIGQSHDRFGQELDQADASEHVVAHDRLDLGHLVGDGLIAVAVAVEDAAGGVGRQ